MVTNKDLIGAADSMAHVCAYVSGRLDICGLSGKSALELISECRKKLYEAASSWWKTKGTDEDGLPGKRVISINDEVFQHDIPYNFMCTSCGRGMPTWSDDYEPLFTLMCKECGAHTKPALTNDIARHRWLFDRLIKPGETTSL